MKLVKTTLYSLVLVLASISFTACERDANNVEIPTIEPKLVVQCFISPQKPVIKAYVSLSSPIFGVYRNTDWINDANVEISNGSITKKMVLNNTSTIEPYYEIDSNDFKIEAGKTYMLMVSTPDGKTINAECTVPYPVDGTTITYNWDSISNVDINGGVKELKFRMNMQWRDVEQGLNYYRAGANVLLHPIDDSTRISSGRMYNDYFTDLQTDEGKDFGTFSRNGMEHTIMEYIGGSTGSFSFRAIGFDIYVLNCDENYYKYHKSAEGNNGGDDPFSEPTLVYSNIIGGLGCFGASNDFIKSVRF